MGYNFSYMNCKIVKNEKTCQLPQITKHMHWNQGTLAAVQFFILILI